MPSFADVSGLQGLCGNKVRSRGAAVQDRLLLPRRDRPLKATFRAQQVLGFFEGVLQVGLDAAEAGTNGNRGIGRDGSEHSTASLSPGPAGRQCPTDCFVGRSRRRQTPRQRSDDLGNIHNARERLLVGVNAPDFDGLADAEVPVHHHRRAVMTDVDPLTFPQEIVPTFNGDGKTKAQTQKDSFTAAKIFLQDSRGWPTSFENGMAGTVAVILCQPTRPFKKNRWELLRRQLRRRQQSLCCQRGASTAANR